MFIRLGRKTLDSHLALQVEPVPMLTEECLVAAKIDYCPMCGDFFQNHPSPDMEGQFELIRSSWPKGKHLIQLVETLEVIASEEFRAAVKKHGLSGICFKQYGQFVANAAPVTRRIQSPPENPEPVLETILAQRESLKKFARIEISIEDDATPEKADAETRKNAVQIAELLDSKAKPNDVVVLGESNHPFVVPIATKEIKGGVYVGDSTYAIELKHHKSERAFLEEALFCVTFMTPDRIMFTKDNVVTASEALGVPVYRQRFVDDETVERYLLSESVRGCLAKVDFKLLARLFLSPIQLEAASKLKDPSACVAQVGVFMELLNSLACARKPEKEKPAANKKRSANRG